MKRRVVKKYLLVTEEKAIEDIVLIEADPSSIFLKIDRIGEKVILYSLERAGVQCITIKLYIVLSNQEFGNDVDTLIYIDSFNSKSLGMTFHVFREM